METELQLIKKMESNVDFVISDFKNLQKKYPNEYVAIFNGKVIGDEKNLESLSKKVNERVKDANERLFVLIKYIPDKMVDIII